MRETDEYFECTERVLFVYGKERKFREPNGIARPLASALYLLRELKYGEASRPLPAYVCGRSKEQAFLASADDFTRFFTHGKGDKYDWDRTPLSPCPQLVSDLLNSAAIGKVRVFDLKGNGLNGERAFNAALSSAQAVQTTMFRKEKKEIDESNFFKVYEYWVSLFGDAITGADGSKRSGNAGGRERKLAEYFLADIERGGVEKRGKYEFTFGEERVGVALPTYEYNYFWSLYSRVTDEKTVVAIRQKIDRLSEDFARRFEGEFYTPVAFAEKAYEYIEKTIGKKKLESGQYRIWDMAAGSGNLEFTLPSAALPYTYLSTLNEDDANYCRRIFPNAAGVFRYDYLNDDVDELFPPKSPKGKSENDGTADGTAGGGGLKMPESLVGGLKMPESLVRDLKDPKLKWLIFINPPFATSNKTSLSHGKLSKTGVSDTALRRAMLEDGFGETGRELFSQFLYRISREFAGKKAYLGLFSTLKYLNAPNDKKLRDGFFRYQAERGFVFSSENFEGSKGKFPVAFVVWNMSVSTSLEKQTLEFDVFDNEAKKIGRKRIWTGDRGALLSSWTPRPATSRVFPPFTGAYNVGENNADVRDRVADGFLCSLMCCGNDFQHVNQTALFSGPQASAGSFSVTKDNFERAMATHAVRRLQKPTWSNNRDQFYVPIEEPDEGFFTDCAVWSVFSDSNNATSFAEIVYKGEKYRVRNHLFPFTQAELKRWGVSLSEKEEKEGDSFFSAWLSRRSVSEEANAVLECARAFYSYCYANQKAEIWDAGYPQLKAAVLSDDRGMALLNDLKTAVRALGAAISPRVFELGFAPRDVEYFEE